MKATEEQKQKFREYYQKNKEAARLRARNYYELNREQLLDIQKNKPNEVLIRRREYQKQYRAENKEKVSNYFKINRARYRKHSVEYYKQNSERLKKRNSKYMSKRKSEDINFKIACLIRSRIGSAMRRNSKKGKSLDLLGCSIQDLKIRLESMFLPGMSWKNHGLKGWHIDHIKPCASFDLTKEEEQRKCFHYSNLQPLWAFDNQSKKDKLLC